MAGDRKGPSFDLVFDDSQIVALLDSVERGAQNAMKRALRACLKVFREADATYVSSQGWPQRWRNPNRGYRTRVDTALTYNESATVKGADGKFTRNRNRTATGFRIIGKLFSKYPGSFYETGQRAHWIRVTPALLRWARRHGVDKKLLQRQGIWVKQHGTVTVGGKTSAKSGWVRKQSGKLQFYGKRWFVPFQGNPRLERWAQAHHMVTPRYMHVNQQPPRPFVKPGARKATSEAQAAFRKTVLEYLEAKRG